MKLIADHVTYQYNKGTEQEIYALKDVNFVIHPGEFIGLIGHTGSGKSTLVQHLNGLLMPDAGTIYFDGEDITEKGYDKKKLRSKVGLVFQYPEHQLFEETVFADVCFGPKNMGLSRKEAELKAYEALKKVGVEEIYFDQSPFDLSGGQKRRVAIAGVLAMQPEILVLDEPTAGLDPAGREEILSQIKKIHSEGNMTVILVSHSMEDVARLVDRLIVMNEGRVFADGTVNEVFSRGRELSKIGLGVPQINILIDELIKRGLDISKNIYTVEAAKEELLRYINEAREGQKNA